MEEEGGERKPEYLKKTPDTQFCGGVTHTENVPRRDLNLEFIPAVVTSDYQAPRVEFRKGYIFTTQDFQCGNGRL